MHYIKRISLLFSFFILLVSCLSFGKKIQKETNEIKVYKFMHLDTYGYSITEDMFWEHRKLEHVQTTITNIFDKTLIKEVRELQKLNVKDGLVENFDFAFIQGKDTIYAFLVQDLWTIKKEKKFECFKDSSGKLKKLLQEHSSFFANCW